MRRPLEACCWPWTWCCNYATALTGYANMMMMMRRKSNKHLIFCYQMSALSQSSYYHIWPWCIHPYLNSAITCNSATTIINYKCDYCNALCYNLASSRFRILLLTLLLRLLKAVTSLLSHNSLHWLQITKHIKKKLLSLTYKVFSPHHQALSIPA